MICLRRNLYKWDSGVDVQLLCTRNWYKNWILEVHTTKYLSCGLPIVAWASKYYKKGEGIKRYEVHTTEISWRETLRKCPFLVMWSSYRRFLVFLSILDSP